MESNPDRPFDAQGDLGELGPLLVEARPPTSGPRIEVTARHRGRLERAMAVEPVALRRRVRRRLATPYGRVALTGAAAAVLVAAMAVVRAGGRPDGGFSVETDITSTIPTDPISDNQSSGGSGAPVEGNPNAGTTASPDEGDEGAEGAATGSDGRGEQPAEVEPQLIDGEVPLCGAVLPDGVEILPGPVPLDSIEAIPGDLAGQLAERLRRGTTIVEYRWPATPRLVDGTEEEQPRWPESVMPTEEAGLHQLWLARDPTVPVDRDPVEGPPFAHGSEPVMGQTRPDGTDEWVIDWLSEELLRRPVDAPLELEPGCEVIGFEIHELRDGAEILIERFGVDLQPDQDYWSIVPMEPLIAERREVATPPTEVSECEGGGPEFPPNESGVGDGSSHPTAPEALIAYLLSGDGVVAYGGGWVEMTVPDGSRVYGSGSFDDGHFFALVTVVPDGAGGWTVVSWEHTGC